MLSRGGDGFLLDCYTESLFFCLSVLEGEGCGLFSVIWSGSSVTFYLLANLLGELNLDLERLLGGFSIDSLASACTISC